MSVKQEDYGFNPYGHGRNSMPNYEYNPLHQNAFAGADINMPQSVGDHHKMYPHQMWEYNIEHKDVPMGNFDIQPQPKWEIITLSVMPEDGQERTWIREFPLFRDIDVIDPKGHKMKI